MKLEGADCLFATERRGEHGSDLDELSSVVAHASIPPSYGGGYRRRQDCSVREWRARVLARLVLPGMQASILRLRCWVRRTECETQQVLNHIALLAGREA